VELDCGYEFTYLTQQILKILSNIFILHLMFTGTSFDMAMLWGNVREHNLKALGSVKEDILRASRSTPSRLVRPLRPRWRGTEGGRRSGKYVVSFKSQKLRQIEIEPSHATILGKQRYTLQFTVCVTKSATRRTVKFKRKLQM
jgi:hypothetical protein